MAAKKLTSLTRDLSDWEVIEAYRDYKSGTTMIVLAARYGVNKKTLERAFRKLERMEATNGHKEGAE